MAKGSHSTWDDYPHECAAECGRPLRITKDRVWMECRDGARLSWHMECRLALIAARHVSD